MNKIFRDCVVHFHQYKTKRKPVAILSFHVPEINLYVTGENIMALLPSGMRGTPSVVWRDKRGNVAEVDPNNPVVWTSDDPAVAEIVDVGGITKVRGLLAGATLIHANADADLGEGIVPVTATLPIEVPAGQATGGEVSLADLEPDPDA